VDCAVGHVTHVYHAASKGVAKSYWRSSVSKQWQNTCRAELFYFFFNLKLKVVVAVLATL